MTKPKDHGTSADGTVLTDDVLDRVAAEAEVGYDVDDLLKRRGRGRPPMGTAAADVFPVRLDPELRASVAERAERDRVGQGEIIRRAIRHYLEV
jgi:hypothetical protein